MELVISLLSVAGFNGILLFFIKRFFDRRDKKEADLLKEQKEKDQKREEEQEKIYEQIRISLETIERLLTQGYATPAERRILDEMYHNYKEHGWNGDMDARLEKVYALRTDHS